MIDVNSKTSIQYGIIRNNPFGMLNEDKGIESIISVAVDYATTLESISNAKMSEKVYAAVACSPSFYGRVCFLKDIIVSTNFDKIAAIGESGLCYPARRKELQIKSFIEHIDFANQHDLPMILQCENAIEDLINVITHNKIENGFVISNFKGQTEDVDRIIELGGYISFSSSSEPEIIKYVPFDKVLLETGAKASLYNPESISKLYQSISLEREENLDVMSSNINNNARKLFKKIR